MDSLTSLSARLSRGSIGRLVLPALLPLLVRLVFGSVYLAFLPWPDLGDIAFYYTLGQQSDAGFYPYLHYWMEYPPIFPWLVVGLWRGLAWLSAAAPTAVQFWTAYPLLMFCVDAANVVLVQLVARRVHGPRAARLAALVYAASPVAVWYSAGWYDPLAVLAFLSGLLAVLDRRARTAGVLIGLGILTKVYPGVLLLALPVAMGWRATWRAVAATIGTLAVVLVPLAVLRGDLLVASLTAMLTRRAWETVPALLTGNFAWGYIVPLTERFTAGTAVAVDSTASARVIALVVQATLVVVLWAAWRLLRADDRGPRQTVALATLGVAAFMLSNKGYSPQFVIWLLPLLLVMWPNRRGLLYCMWFSLHVLAYYRLVLPTIAQYYLYDSVTAETVALASWLSVGSRTLLLAWIVGHLCQEIRAMVRVRATVDERPPLTAAEPAPAFVPARAA